MFFVFFARKLLIYYQKYFKCKFRNQEKNIFSRFKILFVRSDFVSSHSLFITEMQSSIEEAFNYTPYVNLTRNINADFLQLNNSQLRNCLSLFNLTNVIDELTRITPNAATLIYPVLLNDSCIVLDSGILNVDGIISDHKATYVSISINVNLSTSYYREVWNYKNVVNTTLNNLIEECNLASIINEPLLVDEACEHFSSKFMEFCKACIPSRNGLIRENDKPWFTSEIRYNIRLRDRLRKLFLKSGRIADRLSYKRQRNKVNNMKTFAEENCINNIDNIISNHDTSSSSKTFWRIMGRFMGKSNTSTNIPHLHIGDNKFAFSNQEKTDALNKFFISVYDIEEANILLPNFNRRTESVLSRTRVSEFEVKDILNTLKVNKATGPDGISNRMLKHN